MIVICPSSSVGQSAADSSGYMMRVVQWSLPLMFQHHPQSHIHQPLPDEHLHSAPPTALYKEQATMYSWTLVGISHNVIHMLLIRFINLFTISNGGNWN